MKMFVFIWISLGIIGVGLAWLATTANDRRNQAAYRKPDPWCPSPLELIMMIVVGSFIGPFSMIFAVVFGLMFAFTACENTRFIEWLKAPLCK